MHDPRARDRPAIGIVCKAPRPGAVKTRLAAAIGPVAAAELAAAFLRDTAAAVAALPVAPWLIHAPADAADEIAPLLPRPFRRHPQRGGDLGAMMADALHAMLAAGHPAAALVGTDVPDLPADRWATALAAMQDPAIDAVFGPATDGGYWLVGLRRPLPMLFEGVAWSTAAVLAETEAIAAAAGLNLALTAPWTDIDDAADLRALIRRLDDRDGMSGAAVAPATRAALLGVAGLPGRRDRR